MKTLRGIAIGLLVGLLCTILTAQVSAPTTMAVNDEGTLQGRVSSLNFVGAGVISTVVAGVGVVTIAGGAGAAMTEFELDFTTCGVSAAQGSLTCKVTVTDATVLATSKILITQSGNAPTGRQADENEMDFISCNALPAIGSFVMTCGSLHGPMDGKYKVFYTVG